MASRQAAGGPGRGERGGPIFSHALWAVHDLDSGALSMKAVVAHPVAEPGRHHGTLMLGDRVVARFVVECGGGGETQATVDLAELHRRGRAAAPNEVVAQAAVRAGGHLVLHVSHGDRGYRIVLAAPAGARPDAWDSRTLESGDIVSMMPLRPGAYTLRNAAGENGASAPVVVAYPDPRQNARGARRPAPVYATMRAQGFDPGAFDLRPAQGLVVAVTRAARLVLTLDRPDDGSDEVRHWHAQQRALLLRAARRPRDEIGPAAAD
jgi:hypothetical protein